MTADDISTRLCCIITQASTDALIAVPSIEQATKRELEDAAYKMVCDSLDRTPPFPKYRELLFQWLRVGLRSALLYAHRSRAFCYCKKYNQAHDDALSALEEIKNLEKVPNKTPCVQLTVEITTKSISSKRIIDELSENLRCHTVSNTESGAEYLRGKLTKDILPEESYWTIDETDGCMLFLKKMNLEIINNE
eukprot:g3479.t1